jgi:exopolyphosphatase/guanosine-5'-triphosphate,3'-diphosphate pyrophosphatase
VRDAINGEHFCKLIESATGIKLEVIDGDTEGKMTLQGVMSALDTPAEHLLTFDVGGGSTEYTLTIHGQLRYSSSLPLGVVRLTEGKGSCAAMLDKICRELSLLKQDLAASGLLHSAMGATLVGTAGTATTLAAISQRLTSYDYRLVNNFRLEKGEIERIFHMLLPLTPAERLDIPGLEKGREDLIIAGILITLQSMDVFGINSLKVSDFGLLEGVLLSM